MKKYSKKAVANRTSNDVCEACGKQFLNYLTERQRDLRSEVYTAWEGECGLCGQKTSVTDYRHYNYLFIPKRVFQK